MKDFCKISILIFMLLCLCSCQTSSSTGEQGKTQDGYELAEMKTNDVEKFVEFMPDNVLNLLIENDVFGIQTKTANGLYSFSTFDDGREDNLSLPAVWYVISDNYTMRVHFLYLSVDENGNLLVTYDSLGVFNENTKEGNIISAELYEEAWDRMLERQNG